MAASAESSEPASSHPSPHRVLVIAAGIPADIDLIEEVRGGRPGAAVEVAVVAPVVEESPAKRTAGELEPAREAAEQRLEDSLARMRNGGLTADGWVGDTDPVLAAEDALRAFPADEVLVFESAEGHARWLEDGLLERAREILDRPLRLAGASGDAAPSRPVAERAAPQASGESRDEVGLSPYLPGIARDDLAALAVGVVGTILAIVFFAAGDGPDRAPGAAQGLIALAAILINVGHAIGITLFESVRYRGGFQTFVRDVTLVYTPLAALANLVILLVA